MEHIGETSADCHMEKDISNYEVRSQKTNYTNVCFF